MNGMPNQRPGVDAGWPLLFAFQYRRHRAAQAERYCPSQLHTLLHRRIEIPERWFAAFLFAFKLPAVSGAFLLLLWYVFLPSNNSSAQTGIDWRWYFATNDFANVATSVSLLYFLAAGVLVIGSLIQLCKHSYRAAAWSISFGIFALTVGIVLAVCISSANGYYEIFGSEG